MEKRSQDKTAQDKTSNRDKTNKDYRSKGTKHLMGITLTRLRTKGLMGTKHLK